MAPRTYAKHNEKYALSGSVPGHEEGSDGIVQDTVGALTLAQSCSAHAILDEAQPNGQGQQPTKSSTLILITETQ